MRLTWGVNKEGLLFVVDDDRSHHEAISGPLNHFEAAVFIARLNRKFLKSQMIKNDPIPNSKKTRLPVTCAGSYGYKAKSADADKLAQA